MSMCKPNPVNCQGFQPLVDWLGERHEANGAGSGWGKKLRNRSNDSTLSKTAGKVKQS